MIPFRPGQLGICGSLNAIIGSLDIIKKYRLAHESARFTAEWVFEESLETDIDTYQRIIPGNIAALAMHGISGYIRDCANLGHPSPDLRLHAKKKYLQCVERCERLKAKHIVFHQWHMPHRVPGFNTDDWLRQADIWPEIGDAAQKFGILIVLENDCTPLPELAVSLIERINHPNVKLHLDIAHAQVQSKAPIKDWIDAVSPHLRCLHINNNDGIKDLHQPLSDGIIDYALVFEWLQPFWNQLEMIAIETDPNQRDDFIKSLNYLESLGLINTSEIVYPPSN